MVNSFKIDLTEPDARRRPQKHTAEFKAEIHEKGKGKASRRENPKRSDFDLSQF